MEIDVTATLEEVDFLATGLKEIMQNIKTIVSTLKGTVPLDRSFGVNSDLIDMPMPKAQSRLTAEIVAAIEKYEPRCKVVKVTFTGDGIDGILIPKVRVKIDEQYI